MKKVKLPFVKRLFDVIASLVIFLFFLPFLFLLLLWIIIEYVFYPPSRGGLFYSEIRISQGESFKFYKFRIFKDLVLKKVMKEKGFIHTKPLEKDPNNLTYYGRFLKKIYMDELPQLFNVFKGDMTLVGPRPTNIENSKKLVDRGIYTKEIMKCGLTGSYQSIKGSPGKRDEEMDMEYINFIAFNSGFAILIYDFKILLKTIKTILEVKGI